MQNLQDKLDRRIVRADARLRPVSLLEVFYNAGD